MPIAGKLILLNKKVLMLMNTSNRNHKTYNSSRPLKNVFPYNFFKNLLVQKHKNIITNTILAMM